MAATSTRSKTTLVLFLFFLLISPLMSVGSAAAQPATPAAGSSTTPQFGMNPVGDFPTGYFEFTLSPGESTALTVSIANIGPVDADLRVYTANAINPPNGGFAAAEETDAQTGVTTWMTVNGDDFVLAVGETRLVEAQVTVPADAAPGQYVTSLVTSTTDALPAENGGMFKQIIRSAVPVVITIPGPLMASFSLGEPEVVRSDSFVEIRIPLVNEGNVLVKPTGQLTLTAADGTVVVDMNVEMGSVYAGNGSSIQVLAPSQVASGAYMLDLTMADPDTGVGSSIEQVSISVPEPVATTGVSLTSAVIQPQGDPIAFANVAITITNSGQQIPSTVVNLLVMHNGQLIDTFPLATNQVLLAGENTFTTRYIPVYLWQQGTYTFQISVLAVDPQGGSQVELLNQIVDQEIIVP